MNLLILILEIEWQRSWFRLKTIRKVDKEMGRIILDKIANQYLIKTPEQWANITNGMVSQMDGGSSLLSHYGGSLLKALRDIYEGK